LAKSLAAYVILRSKEPLSEVINDLFEIETEAASLVGSFYSDDKRITNLKGSLASVFRSSLSAGESLRKTLHLKNQSDLPHRSSAQKKKSRRTKR
jgi:hypothetical protein